MKKTSAMVMEKWTYSRVLTWRLVAGCKMVPLSDCRRMSPSTHMLAKKHAKVPNSHAIAVFPAAQRLSKPWCAPVVMRCRVSSVGWRRQV